MVPKSLMKKPMPDLSVSDNFIVHANNVWKRMNAVRNGNIPYVFDDYSTLINVLERYYKGYLQIQTKYNPGFKLPKNYLNCDHDLLKLVHKIEGSDFMALSAPLNQSEQAERTRFYTTLRSMYTKARYTMMPQKKDFDELYEFVKLQRELILEDLSKKYKETTQIPTLEEDFEETNEMAAVLGEEELDAELEVIE